MAKAYLIGGTPRTGKTNLVLRAIKERPMMATSTDAIRYALRRVIKEADEPDLFHLGKFTSNNPEQSDYLKNNLEAVINIQNNESAIVWRSVKDFISSNIEDGYDILVEGIAILPELIKQLDCEYRAIFMGNQSARHYHTILRSARDNNSDWMHVLEDETIEAFTIFNQAFSSYIGKSAINNGFPYIEVHDNHYEEDITMALSTLLS